MMGLTRRQRACLEALRDYQIEHGAMPTLEELRVAMGVKSRSAVSTLLNRLQQRGAVKRVPGRQRGIALRHCLLCGQDLRGSR